MSAVGNPDNHETRFNPDNYEAFYEHHHFDPIPEALATDAHEVLPRFGWAFDKIEEFSSRTVLDLGCLDGSFVLTIARHLGCTVTGIDLTKDGIALAKQRAEKFGVEAEFHQGFAEDWLERFTAEGRKFDVVTFFEVIEHVEDVPRLLRLIDGVLAPGGDVLVSTPAFEDPQFGKDDEANKCHIRLYTTADDDREEYNRYGNLRKATSLTKEIGIERIKEMGVYSHLINAHYK